MIWLPDLAGDNFETLRKEHSPLVAELVAVHWPDPDGTVYYCSTQADEVFSVEAPVRPIEIRFEANQFLDLQIEDGISDSQITLNFWDGDEAIAELYHRHGPGARVEVFYWFPEHGYLISQWHGHLDAPDEEDGEFFRVNAAYGFRSSQLPLPRRAFFPGCQAVFGGLLNTQAEIDEGDCGYNRHLPGGTVGNLDGNGQPFKSCPRNNRPVCIARLEPPGTPENLALSYLAVDVVLEGYPNARLISQARSNTNNLKRPLRVVYGPYVVRDLDLLGFAVDVNTDKPDKGWVLCNFAVCEGELAYVTDFKINNTYVGWQHQTTRTGAKRQAPTFFTPNEGNMSGTARAVGRIQGNFQGSTGSDLNGQVRVGPKINTRVYTSPTSFYQTGTNNRAWVLLDAWRDKRWGYGADVKRLVLQDWIDLAAWCDQRVPVLDASGNPILEEDENEEMVPPRRSTFQGQLLDKTAQRQVYDICLAGNITIPFPVRGETRIMPLAKEDNLDACPVFTDEGEDRNICVADETTGKSSLTTWETSVRELANRVVVTFDDASIEYNERPLTFEDVDQQLRAGRAFGDNSRFPVTKQYKLLGVTAFGQAVRMGNILLDLGPFAGTTDEGGGLKNNRRIKFTTWFTETLACYKNQVIRVLSRKTRRYGFEYWRICSLTRQADLKVEIVAQAHPVDYYAMLESAEGATMLRLGSIGTKNPGGPYDGRPESKSFGTITQTEDKIIFTVV